MDPLRRIPIGSKLALAREMRREATPAERYAWSLLRNRQVLGRKFRRQHVLHGVIVDFYCAELKLVLELDGDPHDDRARADYDSARTAWLESAGYRVVRIRNNDLTRPRLERLVVDVMGAQKQDVVPPLPKGEGDRGRGP